MKRLSLALVCLVLGGVAAVVGQWVWTAREAPAAAGGAGAAAPKELTSYRGVVKKVLPAVVSIEAFSRSGRAMLRLPAEPALPGERPRPRDADTQLVDDEVPGRIGSGSGFLVSAKGVVVTNNHVVEGAERVVVKMGDGKKFTSTKVRRDPKTDLAIVLIDNAQGLPQLEWADSDAMEIGDRVLAVGAPFGLAGTVTSGIVSSKGRRALRVNMYEDFLQTDAAINPGNSGGPLVNLEGQVIGITSAIKSSTRGSQGVGLAISSKLAKTIVAALLKDGVVRRGYLGVGVRDVDDELAKELGLKEARGVQVTRTYADAPGEKGGLKSGDVIVKLGAKAIKDRYELQEVVAGLPLNKPVAVEVLRDGKSTALKVTIEEQPRNFGATRRPAIPPPGRGAFVVEKIGVTVCDLTAELAEALDFPDSVQGALITEMQRRGPAAAKGLQPGEVITSVNGTAVKTARAVVQAVAKGSLSRGISLQVRPAKGPARTVVLRDAEE